MYSDYNYSDAHVKIGRLTTVEPDVIRDAINDKITSKNTHFYQNYPGLNPAHIFCRPLTKSELHPPSGTAFHGPNGNDMALCLNIDFEWYTPGLPDILANCATKTQYPRELVTCQVRSVVHEKSYILVSSKAAENGTPRHSVMDIKDHFAFLALVRYYYPEAVVNNDPERTDLDELPKLQIVIFAHFLLVDLGASCISNEALSFFEKGVKTNKIRQQRRLSSGKYGRDLKTKFTITLEGVEYAIQFKLIDTLGLYGNATYKAACEIAGITLNVKDKMQAYIENMHLAYYAEPDDFDEYAHQDTYTSDIIYNHNRLMTKVCIEIGIQRQFDKLTMGSTVNGLFEQRLRDITGLHKLTKKRGKKKKSKVNLIVPLDEVVTDESTRSENDPLKGLTECASADYLKNMINTKAHLLAKCNGGRCRNAQPTTSALKNKVLVDIDISGAYTGAMQRLSYCLGRPVIIAFNNNQCKLKNFLKYHRKDLSPGQWYMRISTSELLKYPQHLFLSWFDLQQDTRTFKQDSESYDITGEVDLDSGENKILLHEIISAPLTCYELEVIKKTWSKRQQEDFFDKVYIDAIIFYPTTYRKNDLEDYNARHIKPFKGFECHLPHEEILNAADPHWFSLDLGDLLINKLRDGRSRYPKSDPLNTLFKLLANTTYGNAVSKYFATSNVVLGNNITAMCRAAMYCAEIGLNLVGSITDGHFFDINKVTYRAKNKYLNLDQSPYFYTKTTKGLLQGDIAKRASLFATGAYFEEGYLWLDSQKYNETEAKKIVDKRAKEHLMTLFPDLDFLKHINFEMKNFASSLTIHGSANYQFKNLFGGKIESKFRSAESKRQHYNVGRGKEKELICHSDFYDESPGFKILSSIAKNPERTPILPIAVKTTIIKTAEYVSRTTQGNRPWKHTTLIPGDNGYKIVTPSYFSLAQFTYQTHAQYLIYKKTASKLKSKCGVSFELFFMNDDGTLNFALMCKTIDEMIRKGEMSPVHYLDRSNNKHRNATTALKERYEISLQIKELFRELMCGCEDNDANFMSDNESW